MQENKAISRRTLAKASAWAVPVLAVAAAAPAHATSTDVEIPCPDNVFPGSGWVTTFGGSMPAFRGHTQSGPAGSVLVQPPTNCSSGSPHNGRPVRGANGTSGLFHTVNYTYTATVTVTVTVTGITTVQIRLDMDATSSGNNDDWHITPRFTECTRPAWRRLA